MREGRPQDACDPRLLVAPGRPAGRRLPMGPVAINRRPLRLGAEKGRQLQAALRREGQPWSLCGSAATATLPSGRKAGRSHSAEPPPRVVRRRSCTSPALRALAAGREEQGQPPPRVRGHRRLLPHRGAVRGGAQRGGLRVPCTCRGGGRGGGSVNKLWWQLACVPGRSAESPRTFPRPLVSQLLWAGDSVNNTPTPVAREGLIFHARPMALARLCRTPGSSAVRFLQEAPGRGGPGP